MRAKNFFLWLDKSVWVSVVNFLFNKHFNTPSASATAPSSADRFGNLMTPIRERPDKLPQEWTEWLSRANLVSDETEILHIIKAAAARSTYTCWGLFLLHCHPPRSSCKMLFSMPLCPVEIKCQEKNRTENRFGRTNRQEKCMGLSKTFHKENSCRSTLIAG